MNQDQNISNEIDDQGTDAVQQQEATHPWEKLAELIRRNSMEGRLTSLDNLKDVELTEDTPLEEQVKLLLTNETYSGIIKVEGKKDQYFYDQQFMAKNYANILVKIEDGNLFELVASTVRHESKLYPRPTDARLFLKPPFNFHKESLEKVLNQIKDYEAYQDIQEVRASNGALYLYSTEHLSQPYAKSLAQWIEIEQYETP